jgi:hypothetical protein
MDREPTGRGVNSIARRNNTETIPPPHASVIAEYDDWEGVGGQGDNWNQGLVDRYY